MSSISSGGGGGNSSNNSSSRENLSGSGSGIQLKSFQIQPKNLAGSSFRILNDDPMDESDYNSSNSSSNINNNRDNLNLFALPKQLQTTTTTTTTSTSSPLGKQNNNINMDFKPSPNKQLLTLPLILNEGIGISGSSNTINNNNGKVLENSPSSSSSTPPQNASIHTQNQPHHINNLTNGNQIQNNNSGNSINSSNNGELNLSSNSNYLSVVDNLGKLDNIQRTYEREIESYLSKIQMYIEREQKYRSQIKSLEDINLKMESDYHQLKMQNFELQRKLQSEIESNNNNNQNNNNSRITSNETSSFSILNKDTLQLQLQQPPSFTIPPILNSSNNNNKNLKKKMEIHNTNSSNNNNNNNNKKKSNKSNMDGDEEMLVAEALGSFSELTNNQGRKIPSLKRSNSEEFIPSLSQSGQFLSSSSNQINWSSSNSNSSSNNSFSPIDQGKHKKRKSESQPNEILNHVNSQQIPKIIPNINNSKSNSPPNHIKIEKLSSSNSSISPPNNNPNNNNSSSYNNNNNQRKSISINSLQQSIPEMETDENIEELEFKNNSNNNNNNYNSNPNDEESPDSNSRNSSSPIDAPIINDINLFKPSNGNADTPHELLLNEIHLLYNTQREMLESMQKTQKQFLTDQNFHTEEVLQALQSEQLKMTSQIDTELVTLGQLYSQTVLEPNQLCKLDLLMQDISIQLKQLQLYQMELNGVHSSLISNNGGIDYPAALVITKQPFPMVISKFKQLQEDHLCVQLLTGSNVDFVSISPIRAELIFHPKTIPKGANSMVSTSTSIGGTGGSGTSGSKKHIDKDTQLLDPIKGVAKFPIKFLTGTRKSCVRIHFALQIKTADQQIIQVPSMTSQPFIVITNDCQWEGSEGTLLKKESFNDKYEITWANFVNILQKHFLKATKQSPIQPTRPLSSYDYVYLNSTFFAQRSFVSHKDFDHFWTWFGKCIQTLRYKRHISTLWQIGLIFMFLKRDIVNAILKDQPPGTFCILFSEKFPGQLEISYIPQSNTNNSNDSITNNSSSSGGTSSNDTSKVKHYLVQPNDTSGSKRTLPDFLNECPQFTHILQLQVPTISQYQPDSVPPFKRELKNQVLEPYYSKRQLSTNILGSGYDPLY